MDGILFSHRVNHALHYLADTWRQRPSGQRVRHNPVVLGSSPALTASWILADPLAPVSVRLYGSVHCRRI